MSLISYNKCIEITIKLIPMAEKLRQAYIKAIMQNNYADDDSKYDSKNKAFLETLTLDELQNLSEEIILEA